MNKKRFNQEYISETYRAKRKDFKKKVALCGLGLLGNVAFCIFFLMFSGCAVSTQRFVDTSYDDAGNIVREVRAKSRTYSPPFVNARSKDDHRLYMIEDESGWAIEMGSDTDLTGGNSAEVAGAVVEAIKPSLIPR